MKVRVVVVGVVVVVSGAVVASPGVAGVAIAAVVDAIITHVNINAVAAIKGAKAIMVARCTVTAIEARSSSGWP